MSGEPFPKSKQLARGTRRRPRFRANQAQWEVLHRTKIGPCRVCQSATSNGRLHSDIQLHHIVPRSQGGDDYADNLVPLCGDCHRLIHARDGVAVLLLIAKLTDAEYAYAITKCGEGFFERAYGIEAQRP